MSELLKLATSKNQRKEVFFDALFFLRGLCNEFATSFAEEELGQLKIRDIEFCLISGKEVVRIYLEFNKEHSGILRSVTADECLLFHKYLEDKYFKDDKNRYFEVSSAGIEPNLRELTDFKEALGCMVELGTWEKIDGRNNFKMILKNLESEIIILAEGVQRFEVPFTEVKYAKALWYHKETPKAVLAGHLGAKGKEHRLLKIAKNT